MSKNGYIYQNAEHNNSHLYLLPELEAALSKLNLGNESVVLDLGCGNGFITNYVAGLGFKVVGLDPSDDGIEFASKAFPKIEFYKGEPNELSNYFGKFDCIICLEVIEHIFDPFEFMETITKLLKPEGVLLLSTPYHSYLKNLVLALTGKMDSHFTALWPNGHIKFWSMKTLSLLISSNGFTINKIKRIGRFPALAKSMFFYAKLDALVQRN